MSVLRTIQTIILWILYLPVVGVTYVIAWLDRKVKFSLPFPRDVEELANKKDWCINELKQTGALPVDAVVTNYNVKSINQDLIFRSNAGFIEITYTQNSEPKTLKCFAKFAPTVGTVWNRTIFNLQLNHIKEANFNAHFVGMAGEVPAPKVYYAKCAIFTGNLCLITECMADSMEHEEGKESNFTWQHMRAMLNGMATLHAKFWMDKSSRMKYVMPIEPSTVYLFDSMVWFSWSKAARKILVKSWVHSNEYQTVLHGDARIGNMMFPKAEGVGRFVFFDWQAVRKGRAVYDLAYFLVLSLTTPRRLQDEQKCLDTYYQLLVEKGVKEYTRQEMDADYKHACLCVLVLLSLPMLSGEASAEGYGKKVFAWGMNIWRERMVAKFTEFDYQWVAANYGMSEAEARGAAQEMLTVIDNRLKGLEQGANL